MNTADLLLYLAFIFAVVAFYIVAKDFFKK